MRFLLPLGVLAAIIVLLGIGLTKDPRKLPSVLIDRPAPAFTLPTLANPQQQITSERFAAHPVSLFNVWASWCVACRQEHPLLMQLAKQNAVPIYGLNYKDGRDAARAWLARYGNPYLASAFDNKGLVGIDWGVYGVPETFVVDRQGVIRYKHIGPMTQQDWTDHIQPIVARLQNENP